MIDHSVTVRGATVEDAISKGLSQLGISRDQAHIRIINEGKKGLFGFGKQDAIVEIVHNSDLSLKELTQELEVQQAMTDNSQDKSQDSSSLSQPDQDEQLGIEDESIELIDVVSDSEPARPLPIEEEYQEDSVQVKELGSAENDQYVQARTQVATYIEDVIQAYGAQAEVTAYEEGNRVIFEIETDKSGLIIGRHGKIINSLQVLAQVRLNSLYKRRANVILNVGNYRDRREKVLKQLADKTAQEVLETKQAVILEPLPAYERKQIHAHLSKKDYISTHSEGKEPNRYLVVEYVSR